jgi:hypothetical protein
VIEVRGQPFRNEVFKNAFSDLFSPPVIENGLLTKNGGPMYYILHEHMLDEAKGGIGKFNPNGKYRDTPYFNHVLNFALLSGKTLENHFIQDAPGFDFKLNEPAIRAFFAAIVLHDFNKLHFDGLISEDIRTALKAHRIELERMVRDYVPEYPSRLNDIENLILSTEQGSMGWTDFTDSVYIYFMPQLVPYMRLGDEVSSIMCENVQPYEAYNKISELIRNRFSNVIKEEVKMISLGDRPQTVLRNAVCSSLAEAIEEKGGIVIGMSPLSIIYITPPSHSTVKEIEDTASQYLSKFIENKQLYKIYKPSGNKFDPSFLSWVTEDQLDDYLKEYAHKFFLMEHADRLVRETDLKRKITNIGYRFESRKDDKLTLESVYDGQEGEDLTYSKLLKLFAARRISWTEEFNDENWRESTTEINKLKEEYGLVTPNSVTGKTIESLEYAYNKLKDFDEVYPKMLSSMIKSGKNKWQSPQFDPKFIINSFLNYPIDPELDAPSKRETCIFCGRKGELPFRETSAFGYSATAGTGRKVSELRYVEDYKVCRLCAAEAEMRINIFEDSFDSGGDNIISLHVSMGDYVHPFDVSSLIENIKNNVSNERIFNAPVDKKKQDFKLRLSKIKRDAAQYYFDYHYLSFAPIKKDTEKYDQFLYLLDILHSIRATGFKIRISPLVSGSRLFEEMFVWENAPSWVSSLRLDRIRIDEIDEKITKVDIIWHLMGNKRTEKERASAISRCISTLARAEFSIFTIVRDLAANMEVDKRRSFIEKMYPEVDYYAHKYAESEYMDMKELVEPALGIVRGKYSNPESGNDDTWIIRTAFETVERQRREAEEDMASMIAGNIRAQVMRDSDSFYNADVENSIKFFSENFIRYYKERIGRLNSMNKRDIVNAFGFEYHARKWGLKSQRENANKITQNSGGGADDQ